MEFKLLAALIEAVDRRNNRIVDDEDQPTDAAYRGATPRDGQIDVYGDKVFVMPYAAQFMGWTAQHRKTKEEVGFSHGLKSMDIKAMLYRGQALFVANGNNAPALPDEDLAHYAGEYPPTAQDLAVGAKDSLAETGNQQYIQAYQQLLKEKPNLWADVAKAITAEFQKLESEADNYVED